MIDLTDKVILVSKRIIDEDGGEVFDTFFGKVKSFNENTVVVIKLMDHQEASLPYGDDLYEPLEKGFYELEDGSFFEDPDYVAEFVVYKNDVAYEKYKDLNQVSGPE